MPSGKYWFKKSVRLWELFRDLPLVAGGIQEVPFGRLMPEEDHLVESCRYLFPFTDEDLRYLRQTAMIAKGRFKYAFTGIYLEVGGFYARIMESEDFKATDNISILFGFYADPTKTGNLPRKVRISTASRHYESADRLIFAPLPLFWGTRVLCAKLPCPWLKTPENSPFYIKFYPKGEYPHVNPIGITFDKKGEDD
jgi:hypothetical protein